MNLAGCSPARHSDCAKLALLGMEKNVLINFGATQCNSADHKQLQLTSTQGTGAGTGGSSGRHAKATGTAAPRWDFGVWCCAICLALPELKRSSPSAPCGVSKQLHMATHGNLSPAIFQGMPAREFDPPRDSWLAPQFGDRWEMGSDGRFVQLSGPWITRSAPPRAILVWPPLCGSTTSY